MSDSEDQFNADDGWISWYCNLEDHHFYTKVDQEYIKDQFNLYGLKKLFNHYSEAYNMILDPECPEEDDHNDPKFMNIY